MLSLVLAGIAQGATLKLKDGTTLEGDVKKLGGSYSVRLKDGTTKLVPASDVVSAEGVDGPAAPAVGSASAGSSAGKSASFASVARSADRAETPLIAATLWQKYIDDNPAAPDLGQAKAELKKWQDMTAQGAEKIKGKWVSGEELKELKKKVNALNVEAAQLMKDQQTLKAVDKYNEIIKLYPNSFEAHFEIGYVSLVKGGNQQFDKAISSLETAVKLRPTSPEAHTNLAIAYNFRRQYEKAVLSAYKAAELRDDKHIVQNLVNTLLIAPPGMRANNPKIKPIYEQARVLASRHGIGDGVTNWTYLRPDPRSAPGEPAAAAGPANSSPARARASSCRATATS